MGVDSISGRDLDASTLLVAIKSDGGQDIFPRLLNQSFGLSRAWRLFKRPVSLDIWHAPSYICLKHAWKKLESFDVFLCQYKATNAMSNFGPDGSLYDS